MERKYSPPNDEISTDREAGHQMRPCRSLCRRAFAPERVRDELRHRGAGQLDEHPDSDEFQRAQQAVSLRQQAEHDKAEAEIVGLGQGVQAGE